MEDVDSSMASESADHDHSNNAGSDDAVASASEHPEKSQPPPESAEAGAGGPRTAPTYSAVNAILEKKEDGPGPRCGHTLTAVAPVGEEGTAGYIGPRLILFGGATALEGNSAASSGTPSSAGSAGISMSLFSFFFFFLCPYSRVVSTIVFCCRLMAIVKLFPLNGILLIHEENDRSTNP